MKKFKKQITWTVVIVVIIIFAFGFSKSKKAQELARKYDAKTTVQVERQRGPSASRGTITLTTDWTGFEVPNGYRMTTTLHVNDTWWQVRINRDNNRIFNIPPINKQGGKMVNTGNDTYYKEYRIVPGQVNVAGLMAYNIERD